FYIDQRHTFSPSPRGHRFCRNSETIYWIGLGLSCKRKHQKRKRGHRWPRLDSGPCARASARENVGGQSARVPPRSMLVPSGKTTSWEFARGEPSFAWKPRTLTFVPGGSVSRVQPRRSRALGAPPSTF